MKYRHSAFATARYGSGRASMRALSRLYCFFCSSDPVTSSIHLGAISPASLMELLQSFREEAPDPPEPFEAFPSLRVEGTAGAVGPRAGRKPCPARTSRSMPASTVSRPCAFRGPETEDG